MTEVNQLNMVRMQYTQVRRPRNDTFRNSVSKLIDHEDIWPSY